MTPHRERAIDEPSGEEYRKGHVKFFQNGIGNFVIVPVAIIKRERDKRPGGTCCKLESFAQRYERDASASKVDNHALQKFTADRHSTKIRHLALVRGDRVQAEHQTIPVAVKPAQNTERSHDSAVNGVLDHRRFP